MSFRECFIRYDSQGSILKNISFEVKPGQIIALVVPVAAVNLLLPILYPGSTTLHPVGSPSMGSMWRMRHSLSKTKYRYNSSGHIPFLARFVKILHMEPVHLEEIIEAAKLAHLHDFINGLPAVMRHGRGGAYSLRRQKQRLQSHELLSQHAYSDNG